MNFIPRQLTIDDILNSIITPSDKSSFRCDVSECDNNVIVRIGIKDVNKHEVSIDYKNEYLYISSFSKENNFIYDRGIYIGKIIKKSINIDIEKDYIIVTAIKRKK